jgi:hypothetical protein
MGKHSNKRPEDSAKTPDAQRGGQRDDRPRPALPAPDGKANQPAPTDQAAPGSEVANPLGPAPDLAVVDEESQQVIIERPKRGIGSGMPDDTYKAIVMLLREGVPQVLLSDRFGYSRATISEIKARHADIIPSHRDLMTKKSENLRELLSDKMTEAVQNGRMSANQYAFTFGVVSDKYLTETGQNNQKHEHIHVSLDKNELGSLLSGLNGEAAEKKTKGDVDLPPQKQGDA